MWLVQHIICQAVPTILYVFNLTCHFVDSQGHHADTAGYCAWRTQNGTTMNHFIA